MRTIDIELPQEVVNEAQRAGLEAQSRQGVIDRYFEKHMRDDDASALGAKPFKHFMSLLAEAEAEFELAKDAITNEYLPEYLKNHECEWNLDYNTHIMTVTVKCDCEIPELDKE